MNRQYLNATKIVPDLISKDKIDGRSRRHPWKAPFSKALQ